MTISKFCVLTCVLLRGHLSTHDIAEVFQPVLLVTLCLTSKQEAAVRCSYGDPVLPGAIAVGPSWQASGDAVTVVFVSQEHLAFGKGVLQEDTNSTRFVFLKFRGPLRPTAV